MTADKQAARHHIVFVHILKIHNMILKGNMTSNSDKATDTQFKDVTYLFDNSHFQMSGVNIRILQIDERHMGYIQEF